MFHDFSLRHTNTCRTRRYGKRAQVLLNNVMFGRKSTFRQVGGLAMSAAVPDAEAADPFRVKASIFATSLMIWSGLLAKHVGVRLTRLDDPRGETDTHAE
jgi:sulfite exporter TauE/SafE